MPNLVSCSAWILLALLPVSAPVGPSAPATAPASMHAGPVYTAAPENAEPSAYPKFPEVQVQVELPPGTSPDLILPDALRLAIDGRHAATATRVQTLASTGYGLTASLSLDVSGSMRGGPLNAVRAGLTKFVNDAGPHDKVAIQTIADDSQWDVDWNDPHEKVQMALDRLATRGRLTRLWDGLLIAIDHLPRAPLARRLILISDGHDEGSLHSEEQVIAAATAGGIPIDAIGVTRSDPKYLQALQRLAAETGGQFRAAKDTSELQDFLGSGITRLKSTPVVDFTLARNLGDGAKHHLDVTWTHSGNASMAETAAVLPRVSRFSQQRGLWLGSSAVILLAGIVLIAMAAGKKKPVILPQPAMQLAIAAPAPQPLAAAPPSREPSVPTSPAADRPLPRAFTPPIATSSSDKERALRSAAGGSAGGMAIVRSRFCAGPEICYRPGGILDRGARR